MKNSPFKNEWQEIIFPKIRKIVTDSNIPGIDRNYFDDGNDYVFGHNPLILFFRFMSKRYAIAPFSIKIIVPKDRMRSDCIDNFDVNNDFHSRGNARQILIREDNETEDIKRLRELLNYIRRE